MAQEGFKRKLTAILSADVEGYSRLMGEDEATTVKTLKAYREIMATLIQQNRGRVVDSPGDNLLAEFGSVVDALDCAVKIQHELKAKNSEFPEQSRMEFRIGVNLGDVIEDEERIYGDGVNVAARVEGLADGGGICLSGTAYDQIAKKLPLGYEYLGEQTVKNIENPIRVYRVLMDPEAAGKVIGEKRPISRHWRWAAVALIIVAGALAIWNFYFRPPFEPASVERMAYPLPDKPSIAVLPFDNMSGDPEQEYLTDGISEEIINALSKTEQLFVIARNSTFVYKGKPVKVKQVAEELGVRYVLEGSVRKSEDQVRITAQLIDATKGHHLWSERYDRDIKDIFALQDEITMKILDSLLIKLTEGEQARAWGKKGRNIDLRFKGLEALSLWRKGTKESYTRFGQLGQEMVDMAPEDSSGYRVLAWYNWYLARLGQSPKESIAKAFKLAQKVLSLDESDADSHALLGSIYLAMRQYEKAIAAGKRSIEFEPNGAMVHGLLGLTLSYAGRPDEGIKYLNQGIRLNPFPAFWYFMHLSRCYILKGQYEDALITIKKAIHRNPDAQGNHLYLAIVYTLSERHEEAGAAVKKELEISPSFSLERVKVLFTFKNQADLKLFIDALRKAGLPE